MIKVGIKCNPNEFDERKECDPDFFEVIYKEENLSEIERIMKETNEKKKEIFLHLPTSFVTEEDDNKTTVLLNITSTVDWIRNKSRKIIEKCIENTEKHSPSGWIMHTPTRYNFSIKNGLWGLGTEDELQNGLEWVKEIQKNLLFENIPAAIYQDNEVHFTKPYPIKTLAEEQMPLVLDTAHLYTLISSPEEFINIVKEIVDRILYVHVATLKEDRPYDLHGTIFSATDIEFPSIPLIEETLKIIIQQASSQDIHCVCEPEGNTAIHLQNYQELKRRIIEITNQNQ